MTALFVLSAIAQASAAEAIRRFAFVAATNDGGGERVELRYAETDAQNVARVLNELGGVASHDTLLVLDADRASLERGFDDLRQRLALSGGSRTEVVFYYSGHSDETGLLLGNEELSYNELRTHLDGLDADVRVAMLDSCASGALVRGKGGVHLPAFLVDQSSSVQGMAILTSSSADEAAQEADRIQASFFTHYLVSGLRGAADVSGDGRVTLNEAYRFAFDETLQRTENTGRGAQHPSYDIQLTGTGDLVMTDVAESTSVLVIPSDVQGRLFVRDAQGRLQAELFKPAGRPVELGLGEGTFTVTLESGEVLYEGSVVMQAGERTELSMTGLSEAERVATRARGDEALELREMYVQTSFLPGVGMGAGDTKANFSLNVVAGRGHTVHGMEVGSVINVLEGEMVGLQAAGVGNVVGGDAHGLIAAGVTNVVGGDAYGLHAASINMIGGSGAGLQGAAVNINGRDFTGLQAAAANINGGDFVGLQASAANFNGGDVRGFQVASINVANEVQGAQIGVVNIGRRVNGAQIGVVNISEDVDAPIGLVNIVKNGMQHLVLWSDESASGNIGLKLGSNHVYTMFGFGASPYGTGYTSTSVAMGYRFLLPTFFIDAEGMVQNVYWDTPFFNDDTSPLITRARVSVGLPIFERLAPFAGVSYNLSVPLTSQTQHEDISPIPQATLGSVSGPRAWPGLFAGVQF